MYSPDRLSRKYAYQVLLAEELSALRGGTGISESASRNQPEEDQLLVQFQGMIAEYERAQIIERSRRGKRHKAHEGVVNVLSGLLTDIAICARRTTRQPITRWSRASRRSADGI